MLGQVTIIQIYRLRWPKTTNSIAHLAREVTDQTALSGQRRRQPSESATGASSAVRVDRLAEIKPIQSGSHLHMFCITGSTNFTFDPRHVVFQQCGSLTCADPDEHAQPPSSLQNYKRRSTSSLTVLGHPRDQQMLRSDCAYTQAGLRLLWSHIPHCWESHVGAHFLVI